MTAAIADERLRFSAVLLRPGNTPLTLTKHATVTRFSTVIPGGFGSCDLELPGDYKRWAHEIPYRATLQIHYGTQVIFEGRVEDRGMLWAETGVTTKVSVFGLHRRLRETGIQRCWLQREIEWKTGGDLEYGAVTSGYFDATDLTRVGLDLKYAAEGPYENYFWAYTYLPFQLLRVMGTRSVAPASVYWEITHGTYLPSEVGEPLGVGWGDAALTKTAFNYAIDGGQGVLFGFLTTDAAGGEMQIEDLRLLGTSLTEDVAGGMYGGTILADLVAQVTGISPGEIDDGTDFALPSCAASVRRMAREIVDEICSYYTREWAIWEGGAFDWKQPNLDGVENIIRTPDFLAGTEITGSLDDCYERVFVLYTNAGAADNGFPGEQSATATERRNPFVDSGEHRDVLIQPGFPMTDASALQLATKLLGDYGKFPGIRGQIVLPATKLVEHATLGARPAYLIRAGENVTVPDLPKTEILRAGRDGETQFHIVSTDADLAANRVTLTIEGQAKRADALLARLTAATKLLGA